MKIRKLVLFALICNPLVVFGQLVLIVLCTSWSAFGNTITAHSGQLSDVRSAVNAAHEGDTVIIPPGTYTWSGQLVINGGTFSDGSPKGKSIRLTGEGGVKIINNYKISSTWADQQLIKVQTSSGSMFEMKGINFVEGPALAGSGSVGLVYVEITYKNTFGQSALPENRGKVALVHDCNFISEGNISFMLRLKDRGGVIWNCTFDAKGTGAENGINYHGDDTWKEPSTMGALDTTGLGNTYVEDCEFDDHGNGYALDIAAGARMVIRHCDFVGSMIGSHGLESDYAGMRHAEVYNNTFFGPPSTYAWIHIRGGTWAIHHNSIFVGPKNSIYFSVIALTRKATQLNPPCPTQYPVPRQIGQGWSGGAGSYAYAGYPQYGNGNILDPVYVWQNINNTGGPIPPFAFTDDTDTCGNHLRTADFVRAGRDYFTGVPKPGYSEFPYPHPLRSGSPTEPPTEPEPGPRPTFIQSAKGPIPPGPVTTSSASFANQIAGDSNIVVVSFGSTTLSSITGLTITVTDSQAPSTPYTQVSSAVQSPAGTGCTGFIVFRRIGVSTGPNTITARSNIANEFLDLSVMEYAHAGGAVNDVATGANPNSTSVSLAGTVNEPNKLVLAAVAGWHSGPSEPTSGSFIQRLFFFKMGLSDLVTTGAGPVSVTMTIPGGGGWVGKLIAFTPETSPPPRPAFVQSAKGPIPPSAVTTSSASFASQHAGNSNIVVVSFGSTTLSSITGLTITVTDSQAPSTPYTQVSSAIQGPGGTGCTGFIVFRRIGVSTGPNTITARSNIANEFLDLSVMEYAHAGGAVNDIATGANPNATSVSLAGTVNEPNKLVLSAVAGWHSGPSEPTSGGFTQRLFFFKMGLSDLVTTGAGSVSVTMTIPAGGGWVGKLIAFGPS